MSPSLIFSDDKNSHFVNIYFSNDNTNCEVLRQPLQQVVAIPSFPWTCHDTVINLKKWCT